MASGPLLHLTLPPLSAPFFSSLPLMRTKGYKGRERKVRHDAAESHPSTGDLSPCRGEVAGLQSLQTVIWIHFLTRNG